MKEKRIIDALNNIDERFIEDAAPGKRRAPKKPLYKRLITTAAMLVLLTGAVFWMKNVLPSGGSLPETGATKAEETGQWTAAPETMIPGTEDDEKTGEAETCAIPDSLPQTAAYTEEAAPENQTEDARTEDRTEADPPVDATEEATEEEPVVSPTEAPQTSDASSDLLLFKGDPAELLFVSWSLPEDCVKLELTDKGSNTSRSITDPEVIGQIIALLSPCECTEDADLSANEAGPLDIQICMKDGTRTGLTLYDRCFTCGGYCFQVSEERAALLKPYLER